jgi:hypothetical protein
MTRLNGQAPLDCGGMDEYAEEFALGLLDGAERAGVVAHLEGCRTCGTRVALLAEAGEQLLLIAPIVEPPLGFEQRVLAKVAPQAVSLADHPRPLGRKGWRGRRGERARRPSAWLGSRLSLAAALVLVIGLAALTVGLVRNDQPAPREIAVDMIGAHGEGKVGDATVVASKPMVVELDLARWIGLLEKWPHPPGGPWVLTVDRVGGGHEEHTLTLSESAYDHVTLRQGERPVRSLAIEDSAGHVWCSGNLDVTTT